MTAKQKKRLGETSSFALKVILGALFVSPLIIGLLFSIQSDAELGTIPLKLFTDSPTLANYIGVFERVPLLAYIKNSAIVCVIAIAAQIIFSCMAAYGFVFFDFPGKNLLFTIVLSTMMIPGEVVIITNYKTAQALGVIDSYAGLVMTSLISGTAIFMIRQYFMTVPKDYKDAATIDGCGDMGFLFRVLLPISVPTISSLAIYLFVQIYNQFFWPLLVTSSTEMRTVQIGISFLINADVLSFGRILAGAIVAIIPSTIIYIFGQDYIIKGMTSGGIKG